MSVHDLLERIRALLFSRRDARDLDEEIQFHIDRETQKYRAAGLGEAEARRRAMLAFGGVDRWTEEWRAARGVSGLENWGRDLRLAVRRFTREPALSLPSVLTLALGVGIATAIFTLVNGVLLQPLPYPEPDRVVEVGHLTSGPDLERLGQSPGTYAHYAAGARALSALAIYIENDVSVSVTDGDRPERVRVAMVTPSMFEVIGVPPERGRAFDDGDLRVAPDSASPVIISHDLWARRYDARPELVGSSIELNRRRRQVVGVMPPGFDFPHPDTDVWYAYDFEPSTGDIPRDLMLTGVGRLTPGATPESAEVDLTRMIRGLEASPALAQGAVRPWVTPLKTSRVDEVERPLVALALVGGFLLAITLANVSTLFLVRAERRGPEVSIARALGARASDLRRRFLIEGMVVAAAGGALGIPLAALAVARRFGLSAEALPRLHEVRLGVPGLIFSTSLTVTLGLVIAAVSLLRSRRFAGEGPGGASGSRAVGGRTWRRLHTGLAALQVAIAMALMMASGFAVDSLIRVSAVDVGFAHDRRASFLVNPPFREYPGIEQAAQFHTDLRADLLALPGVERAEVVAWLPLSDAPPTARAHVAPLGEEPDPDMPPAVLNLASPGYFDLMQIPIVRGSLFDLDQAASESPPVMISERLAELLFPDGQAVGRQVSLPGYARFVELPPYTITGVVGDLTHGALTDDPAPLLYFPAELDPAQAGRARYPFIPREMVVVTGTSGPALTSGQIHGVVRALDPKIPVDDLQTLDALVSGASARLRLATLLLILAAVTAMALGLGGVYGIVAYSAGMRRGEMGIRSALGATPRIVTQTLMRGVVPVGAVGLVLGSLATFFLVRILGSQLTLARTQEPTVYVLTAVLLAGVVAAAAWIPARRAGRSSVLEALQAG